MNKTWILNKCTKVDKVEELQKLLGIDEVLCRILVDRGIDDFDKAKRFFRPSLDELHDPFLMKDMDKAIERLQKALINNEKILIYGDYDVDGTTSVALLYNFLSDYSNNLGFYVPDRYNEGYGISINGVNYAAENDYSLVIAIDCGIKAVERMQLAKQLNVDFIICDHHTPDEQLPEAVAILDPLRTDCNYPFKHLSGCGVGFKFLQAFCQSQNIPQDRLFTMLDLVAVSIASDIVSVTDENRVLAYYGLKQLKENPCLGLQKLKELGGIKGNVTLSDVVFKIGPRINASGRMKTADASVELLITQDSTLADAIAEDIQKLNNQRKDLDQTITEQAITQASENKAKKGLVLYNPSWSKGIVGIVASRIVEKFYKPTIILTEENNKISGSARSIEGFDLYDAIAQCEDLLDNFGGHKYAAGLTLKKGKLQEFTERFEQIVSETLAQKELVPKVYIDADLSLSKITTQFYKILKQFEPFGPDNMSPVFVTKNVVDYGMSRRVGKGKKHLRLTLADYDNFSHIKNGIAFSMGDLYETISKGNPFDICYTLQENNYSGRKEIQLHIKDIKV
ncbi:single-stranded-DNA-specific exonuclease [Balneicella halophila]|uniref:Single-stranded-DNA-specific exonuclease RecJ n=1 Tax=Balneicella halophila TaxID=1537566 RepID=A0A7L4UPC8_BALHA|nr:single-stranded-DNA-specific exonuclease RecJ [Balneicella halophila]PVX50737.1 single-stranded-DNA-specific exonuclease [Balneicella halophila]